MDTSNRLMRERWDRKALDYPTHWVSPSHEEIYQDVDDCFEVGREEGVGLLGTVFENLGFDPTGKSILDIRLWYWPHFPRLRSIGVPRYLGSRYFS